VAVDKLINNFKTHRRALDFDYKYVMETWWLWWWHRIFMMRISKISEYDTHQMIHSKYTASWLLYIHIS
jgi:hypothetical protein